MRKMTGRARIMVVGMALGFGAAFLLAILAVSGRLGGWGLLAVLLLAGLAGLGGWMVGVQMRVKLEWDRIWMEGYKDGREKTQAEIQVYYCGNYPPLERLGH